MTIKLYSKFHTPIDLVNRLPSGNHERIMPNAKCWTAEDEGNEFLFQELQGNGFTVRLSSFRIKQPTSFIITAPFTICFQISLFRSTQYELAGFGTVVLHQRRYNLLSVPSFSAQYKISDNALILPLEIFLAPEFLEPLRSTYQQVDEFIKQAQKGRPVALFDIAPIATTEMLAMIDLIIECGRDQFREPDWINIYVSELVCYMLRPKPKTKRVKLTQSEINCLYDGESLISQIELKLNRDESMAVQPEQSDYNLEDEEGVLDDELEWSIKELAQCADMSVYAFTKAFKELFGQSIMNYRKEATWQTVLILLLCGQENLKTISAIAGYNDQPSFSRGFKKRFKCTPSEFVQEWMEKLKNCI